ncbi:hypothetical protein [Neolewinella antarctica]|uniref:Uncharacterized protein n=1 Tax=Neolewinella antarctica TaxID=442734 RepID=A0ABX0X6Q2_9BACT|nr:hypothetical protein [Neolewinella antarctica]NJC24901.1 hypothetical protein [Neolewinella antarctica]
MEPTHDGPLDERAISRDFAVFEHFIRREDMEGMVRTLQAEKIAVRRSTDGTTQWRESVIMGHSLQPKFWIEVRENDFAKAKYTIREAAEAAWTGETIDQHPFADYASDELRTILTQEDYYGIEATVVARNLLLQRGENVALKEIRDANRHRNSAKLSPKEGTQVYVIAGTIIGAVAGLYLNVIAFMAALGVLIYYASGKQRDGDGKQHFIYVARTRVRGKWGTGVVALGLAFGLLNYFWLHWIHIEPVQSWFWLWR